MTKRVESTRMEAGIQRDDEGMQLFTHGGTAYCIGDWVALKNDSERDWVAKIVGFEPNIYRDRLGNETEEESIGNIRCQWAWYLDDLKAEVLGDLNLDVYSEYEVVPSQDFVDSNPVGSIKHKIQVLPYEQFRMLDSFPQTVPNQFPPPIVFYRQTFNSTTGLGPPLLQDVISPILHSSSNHGVYLTDRELSGVKQVPPSLQKQLLSPPFPLKSLIPNDTGHEGCWGGFSMNAQVPLCFAPRNPDIIYYCCSKCSLVFHPTVIGAPTEKKGRPNTPDASFVCNKCLKKQYTAQNVLAPSALTLKGSCKPVLKKKGIRRLPLKKLSVTTANRGASIPRQSTEQRQLPATTPEKRRTSNSKALVSSNVSAASKTESTSSAHPKVLIQQFRNNLGTQQLSTRPPLCRELYEDTSTTHHMINIRRPTGAQITGVGIQKKLHNVHQLPSENSFSSNTAILNQPVGPSAQLSTISSSACLISGYQGIVATSVPTLSAQTSGVPFSGVSNVAHGLTNVGISREAGLGRSQKANDGSIGISSSETVVPAVSVRELRKAKLVECLRRGVRELEERACGIETNLASAEHLAELIEEEFFKRYGRSDARRQKQRFFDIYSNLKRENNADLRKKILTGEMTVLALITADTQALAPEALKKEREAEQQKYFAEQVLLKGMPQPVLRLTHKGLEEIAATRDDITYSATGLPMIAKTKRADHPPSKRKKPSKSLRNSKSDRSVKRSPSESGSSSCSTSSSPSSASATSSSSTITSDEEDDKSDSRDDEELDYPEREKMKTNRKAIMINSMHDNKVISATDCARITNDIDHLGVVKEEEKKHSRGNEGQLVEVSPSNSSSCAESCPSSSVSSSSSHSSSSEAEDDGDNRGSSKSKKSLQNFRSSGSKKKIQQSVSSKEKLTAKCTTPCSDASKFSHSAHMINLNNSSSTLASTVKISDDNNTISPSPSITTTTITSNICQLVENGTFGDETGKSKKKRKVVGGGMKEPMNPPPNIEKYRVEAIADRLRAKLFSINNAVISNIFSTFLDRGLCRVQKLQLNHSSRKVIASS